MHGLVKIFFLGFALVICLTQALAMERGPLSCADVEYLLKGKVSSKRIIELVDQRQTKCANNEQSLSKLKQAGADSELIAAVQRGRSVVSVVTTPPPMPTGRPKEQREAANPPIPKGLPSTPTEKPLRVEVWTDKGTNAVYSEGERIIINVRVNRDAYVRVYYTDASNQTYRIFPNAHRPEARVRAGAVLTLSDAQVTPPFGHESIIVLASDTIMKDSERGTPAGPYLRVTGVPPAEQNMVKERVTLTTRTKL